MLDILNKIPLSDYYYYESLILSAILGGAAGALVRAFRVLNRPRSVQSHPIPATALYVFCGMFVGLVLRTAAERHEWMIPQWDWILVACFGGLVGVGELVSRYRDEPTKAILSVPALLYVMLNAGASILALALGREFKLLPPPASDGLISWSAVMSAGLGAMLVLRSSIFRIRVSKDKDIDVGPSSFVQSLLDAADQAVDRSRAQERAWAVASVMENVAFDKALSVLPSYISALMQNLKPEDQGKFDERVKKILANNNGSPQVKALTLGLVTMDYTGEGVLRAAVASLASEILQRVAKETSSSTKEAAEKARDTKEAVDQVAALAKQVQKDAQIADTPPEFKQTVETVATTAAQAAEAAEDTLKQTQEAEKAAQDAEAVATQVSRAA